MNKTNHFSDRYKSKSTEELSNIMNDDGYQNDAKLAAAWELERRNEVNGGDTDIASNLEAKIELDRNEQQAEQRYQTFVPRLIAAIIDGLLMWPLGLLLNYIISSDIVVVVMLANLLNNAAPYIYSVLLHGRYGQTIGKMVAGIKVVDFKSESQIDIKQAFIRDIVPIILMLVLYIYAIIILLSFQDMDATTGFASLAPMLFIGFLYFAWTILEFVSMVFNEKSRAIHDIIAKTVVVKINN